MSTLEKINRDQRLYVLKCGSGYTCLGYDVAERHRVAAWKWVGQEAPKIRKGSRKHFSDYQAAMAAASHHSDSLRKRGAGSWRCPIHLTPQLTGLEEASGRSDRPERIQRAVLGFAVNRLGTVPYRNQAPGQHGRERGIHPQRRRGSRCRLTHR